MLFSYLWSDNMHVDYVDDLDPKVMEQLAGINKRFQPLGNRVLIEVEETEHAAGSSLIYAPASATQEQKHGTVVDHGGAAALTIENPVLAQANEVVANAEAVGGALPTENSADSGNTPIEAIATPLPNVGATNENQWSASNLTGVTSAETSSIAASSEQTAATPATAVIPSLPTIQQASRIKSIMRNP
jgi:co-chaperonin GroES (HSP10)